MSTRNLLAVLIAGAFLSAPMGALADPKPSPKAPKVQTSSGKVKLSKGGHGHRVGQLLGGVKSDGGGFAFKKGKVTPIPPTGPAKSGTQQMR